MKQNKETRNDPRMEDCYAFVHNVLGASEWIPLYANQHIPESTDEFFLISALVPEDLEEDILSGHNWEISVSSFRPGYTITMMVERIFRMSCRW
jgi:hypothetical protein